VDAEARPAGVSLTVRVLRAVRQGRLDALVSAFDEPNRE
jgi:hypothetical protein